MAHADMPHFPDPEVENKVENKVESGTASDLEREIDLVMESRARVQTFPSSARGPVAVADLDRSFFADEAADSVPSPLDSFYRRMADIMDACTPFFESSAKTARRFEKKIKTFREEKPLEFLGVIAGSAFVLGTAVRLWRSKR